MRFLLLSLLLLTAHPVCQAAASVLRTGTWIRFAVTEEGICRLPYDDIAALGFDPAQVCLYGTDSRALDETPGPVQGETLQAIPVWQDTGSDGVFGPGDGLLFHARGPLVQAFSETEGFIHSLHPWDTRNYYYLSDQGVQRRIELVEQKLTPTVEVDHYDDMVVCEHELYNFEGSGRQWYGEQLSAVKPDRQFQFMLPNADRNQSAQVLCHTAVRCSGTALLSLEGGGAETGARVLPAMDLSDSDADYALEYTAVMTGAVPSEDGSLEVTVRLNSTGGTAYVWVDWIRVLTRSWLKTGQEPLFFRDYYSTGNGQVARFHLSGGDASTMVWDVTDPLGAFALPVFAGAGEATFTADVSSLREFVALQPGQRFLAPVWLDAAEAVVPNQDLAGSEAAELIIVTAPEFLEQAERLADLHRTFDGMAVLVVTSAQVYHAFSGGKTDPSAIRNFLKYKYEQDATPKLQYVLLVGDGTYDNRNSSGNADGNRFMVTWQSAESLSALQSFTSDDFFGILDDGETATDGLMAIGVGRLPVKSAAEAGSAVDKTAAYMAASPSGDWHRTLCFMADDEDMNSHLLQADAMAELLAENHPELHINKLYLDAYPQETTLNGHRYPEVQAALKQALTDGMLIFNYVGHGNETGLTSERVINEVDIETWDNTVFPLFITASCEFGRYDNHMLVTAAEKLLLKPRGGAVALLSASRLVYSELNSQLNMQFYREAFSEGSTYRLGDILRRTKNAVQLGINARSFALLGDPALRLAVPAGRAVLTDINGSAPADARLLPYAQTSLQGEVLAEDGVRDAGFEGTARIVVYGRPTSRHTLNNDLASGSVEFRTDPVIFNGLCSVSQGRFQLDFTMPADAGSVPGPGKITSFAWNSRTGALGSRTVLMGGSGTPDGPDTAGPGIRLFLNDTLFRANGLTDESPTLLALLHDEQGIDISGTVMGHPVTVQLTHPDGSVSSWQVGSSYSANPDDATSGQIRHPLPTLAPGLYELRLQAFDLAGNASEAALPFQVIRRRAVTVRNLYNYPNPMTDGTRFFFEHNQPDEPIEAVIRIYAMDGSLITTLRAGISAGGYTSGGLTWDGRTSSGKKTPAGIYLYSLSLRFSNGRTVTQRAKLMIQ